MRLRMRQRSRGAVCVLAECSCEGAEDCIWRGGKTYVEAAHNTLWRVREVCVTSLLACIWLYTVPYR